MGDHPDPDPEGCPILRALAEGTRSAARTHPARVVSLPTKPLPYPTARDELHTHGWHLPPALRLDELATVTLMASALEHVTCPDLDAAALS